MLIKRIFAFAFVALCFVNIGQTQILEGCGTEPYKDPWLTEFQKTLDFRGVESIDDTMLFIPMQLHILGDDGGVGYLSMFSVLRALCTLNEDFEQVNIQFYLKNEISYIDQTKWFRHDNIDAGAEMMFVNNVDSVLNCYIVQDPAGNCGYNLPYAGIALGKSCMGANDHTWSHEVGHHLSIPHPFLGWEGGQTHDGSKPPVFSVAAPEFVTYDYTKFKKIYYQDTLIIDTALVEKLDGSNCREAADGFCDTKPDYLAQRWNCDANGESPTVQTDPNGETFKSPGQWLMSYVSDNCSTDFSEEQIAAMRANVRQEKTEYLQNVNVESLTPLALEQVSPNDGDIVDIQGVDLIWKSVEGASQYVLQVSRIRTFGLVEIERIVNDTMSFVDGLIEGRRYFWRVVPYNDFQFCHQASSTLSFTPSNVTSTNKIIGINDITILQENGKGHLRFRSEITGEGTLECLNELGQIVNSKKLSVRHGTNVFPIDLADEPTSVYFLRLVIKGQSWSGKFVN